MSSTISSQSSADGQHKQRKFISAVGKPGLARQAREAVAQAVRISSVQSSTNKKKTLVTPLDYENFIIKNRTLLENDALRDVLFFPRDDVTETSQQQQIRTTVSSVTSKHFEDARSSLFTQECLKTYTTDWHLVHFNYELYGTDFAPLIKNCPSDDLNELLYEVDLINDDRNDDESQPSGANYDEKIIKEGYLLKGPESSNDDHQILFKTFKRRYCFLRKDVDASFKIDFYKDKPKSSQTVPNLKATVYLDLCVDVAKASKKGKSYLELKLIHENRKTNVYITADNEQILDEWMCVLQSILEKYQKAAKHSKTDDSTSVGSNQTNESDSGKEETIERLKPPDYPKFCKETDETVSLLRRMNRRNVFSVYSNLEAYLPACDTYMGEKVKPLSEKFGVRFLVECRGISIKLPLPGDLGESQVEPLFVSMFLFDARDGKRLSETFYCDVNSPSIKQFLPCFQTTNEKNGSVSRKSSTAESPRKNSVVVVNNYSSVDARTAAADWIVKLDRKALFSVTHPHSDTYLVVRVDKVLQGSIQTGQEAYIKHDAKMGQKIQKSLPTICSKLGQYRMPFVWAAKPVFQQFIGGTESARDVINLYRQDVAKLCDEELTKLIVEIKKQEKSSKLSILPNASMIVNVDVAVKPETLTNCITSNLLPVVPFSEPQPNGSLTLEIEPFSSATDTVMDSNPYVSYSNSLYVYPISLKYDNQRTFSKARNICCFVEFRDSDVISAPPLKCLFGRQGFDSSLFVSRFGTTVSHHETAPQFYDEIKIILPANINEKHHLLFTFCHVGVESALNSKNKKESTESCVGFSWLPLVKNGKLTAEDEVLLPVAYSLQDGYLSCEHLGFNKGYSGPDIKWVEGGRQLFKVFTRLCSTVMTRDSHLQTFFQCCQRLKEHGLLSDANSPDKTKASPVDDSVPSTNNVSTINEANRELSQNLTLVETRCMINFLPTILNQLFSLLESATNEELALGAVRALVHCVSEVCQANKRDILRAYIKFIFTTSENHEKTVHEELMKAFTCLLRPNRTEQTATTMFLRNLWWFLEIVVKSMSLRLLRSGRIKMSRTERFSSDYLYRVDLFIQTLIPFLCQNYKEFPNECRSACQSVAYFLRACLSLIDRGFVFQLIHFIFTKFDAIESKTLKQMKIDFLHVLCQHEHFLALNLPVVIMKNGVLFRKDREISETELPETAINAADISVVTNSAPAPLTKTRYGGLFQRLLSLGAGMFSTNNSNQPNDSQDHLPDTTAADVAHELRLSEEFCTNHFLVGLLLSLLDECMTESRDLRRKVICILRNLLAKHSFDQRYKGKAQQRLATLYFPLIAILIEHAPYLEVQKEATPNVSPADTLTATTARDSSKRNTIIGDFLVSTPSFARSHQSFNPRQLSLEQLQQQSVDIDSLPTGVKISAETISLETTRSAGEASETSESTLVSKSTLNQKAVSSVPSMLSHTPQFLPYSRFDEDEIKDLLLCAVYVLKNVDEECLSWFWQQCSEAELVSFLKILELCLDLFKYQGKQRIMKATSNRLRSSNKTIRLSPTRDSSTLLTIAENSSSKLRPGSRRQQMVTNSSISNDGSLNLTLAAESPFSVLQEAHLTQEVGLVVLDCLAAFAEHQKNFLSQTHLTATDFLECVCTLYLNFLNKHSSTELVRQTLASLKIFVKNHVAAFLQGPTNLCNQLCRKLLECCNWSISTVQSDACSFLYLLMRLNFETAGRKKFSRIHQQVIISLSQLLGDGKNLNNPIFNRALSILNGYANADKVNPVFAAEVKEVVRRQRTVLMATSQLKEHTDDPEMLADLQKSLADSYAQSPRLRETWLENLARHHCKNFCWAEAAQCYLHIAVLICAELQKNGKMPWAFDLGKSLSDNTRNETVSGDVAVDGETYDEDVLIICVKECARYTMKAERYESLGHLFRLIIPLYEARRNYEALAETYGMLQESYNRVVVNMKTGRRMLGTYFRVIFYNQLLFEQQHNVEYIYREQKLTTLAEMADRLKVQYSLKFGADNVKLITDSCPVNVDSLDPKTAYIQITHVDPYFDVKESLERRTDFERHTNVRRFVFVTPFTAVEGRAHSASVVEQCKRRTILQTSHSFPYVVRRVAVVGRHSEELNPLQTAMDELKIRTFELKKVLLTTPSDLKHLQLRLQGCVLPTVNAGPLAYAEGFCRKEEVEKYGLAQWDCLKETFKEFISVCYDALEVNERLIGSDQVEYQQSLVKQFKEMITRLNSLFNDQMLVVGGSDDGHELPRNRDSLNKHGSALVFDYIGGVS